MQVMVVSNDKKSSGDLHSQFTTLHFIDHIGLHTLIFDLGLSSLKLKFICCVVEWSQDDEHKNI